jgi:hypothetical protein
VFSFVLSAKNTIYCIFVRTTLIIIIIIACDMVSYTPPPPITENIGGGAHFYVGPAK